MSCARRTSLRTLLLVSSALVGGLFSGCQTPKPLPVEMRDSVATNQVRQDPDAVPTWVAEPLSWDKLQHIETWIATDGQNASREWRIEAELELNRGRAEFARRDLNALRAKGGEPDQTIATRLQTARVGFVAVMSDMNATPGQRRRAEESIKTCDGLLTETRRVNTTTQAVPMVARATWGARTPVLARLDKAEGPYRRITVHHSAEPNPVELDGSLRTSCEAVRQIQNAHMNGARTQYGDIGYHYVIDPYGRVFEARKLEWQGAHASGDHNQQNIGICMIGNFEKEKPSAAALEALEKTIEHLRAQHKIGRTELYLHSEFRDTECPGEHMASWVRRYRGVTDNSGKAQAGTVQASAPKKATASKSSANKATASKSSTPKTNAPKSGPKSGAKNSSGKPMPR